MKQIIPNRVGGGKLEPCGKLWPDGQFTLGYAPAGGMERLETPKEYADKLTPPIGLSIDSNSHSQMAVVGDGSGVGRDDGGSGRGQGGITSHQRRLLSNAVSFLQRRHGRKRLSFVTLTLPAVSFEESWNVTSNWSQVVRVFFQRLGRQQKRLGITPHYASCTEMQSERCDREGHPALHLHFVMVGKARGKRGWAFSPCEIRRMWREVVSPYLFKEYDWSACENVQQVKKNAAAYLGKYMSKGTMGAAVPSLRGTGWKLPSQWINVSSKLRRWILDNVRKSPRIFSLIECSIRATDISSAFHYLYEGVLSGLNTPGPHYYVGRLKGDFMRELSEIWRAEVLTT